MYSIIFLLEINALIMSLSKKGLTEEETLVLDRIRAAGTQGWLSVLRFLNVHDLMKFSVVTLIGLWTKHIKTQTQLHQSVVDKCLKTLTQKQLIKTVTDVRVSESFSRPEDDPEVAVTACNTQDIHACASGARC